MDSIVINLEKIPLSGDDLIEISSKMGNSDVSWMLYDDLANINDISELFQGNINTVFLLLQITHTNEVSSVGHWVNIMIDGNDNISYYDPYGLSINEDLIVTKEPDLLSRLLKGRRVEESTFRHQSFKHETQVCGRHCCLRSVFNFLNNKEYNDNVIQPLIVSKQVKDPDVLVSLITGLLSKSDDVIKQILINDPMPETRVSSNRFSLPGSIGGRIV